jgi:two-component system response regulator FixJ
VAATGTVYLIDDDEAVRMSTAMLLESAGLQVSSFDSSKKFLAAARRLHEGCIVTDVCMPEIDGLELQRRLGDLGVMLPVVIMTGHADVPMAIKALKAGASDFIEKPFTEEVLLDAVRKALASLHTRPAANRGAGQEAQDEHQVIRSKLAELTPREREVLDGLVAGKQHKVVANELGISPRTVEVHRARIMDKTGAGSLSELVRWVTLAGR